ncbi:hypothetical protein D9M72_352490 [compost metagenome]
MSLQAVREMVGNRLGVQFGRGDVDCQHRFRAEQRLELPAIGHRLVDHPPVDLGEETGAFGDRHEFIRGNIAEDRRVPAQQRFAACDAAFGVDHRHVDEMELFVRIERAQLVLDLAQPRALIVKRARETGRTVLAAGLRLIHRGIGIRNQLGKVGRIVRADRRADACGHRVALVGDFEAVLEQSQNGGRDFPDRSVAGSRSHENGEFVAGEAGKNGRLLAAPLGNGIDTLADADGQRLQELVADLVAVLVIDELEVVDVDHQQAALLAGGDCLAHGAGGKCVEMAAVADAGQGVGPGTALHEFQRLHRLPMQFADIFRQPPDLAFLLHVADLVARAHHHRHHVGVEACDRVGNEAADQHDDQPDREQAHRHGAERQQDLLPGQQRIEMFARNRERRIERGPEMNACRKVFGNRQRPGLEHDVGAVFLLQRLLHVEEAVRLDRDLDEQSARFLARQRPGEGDRIEEEGINDAWSLSRFVKIGPVGERVFADQAAGEVELGLVDLGEGVPAVFEIVVRLQIGSQQRQRHVARRVVQE